MQSIPMSHIYYDFLKEKFCSGKYESNIIDEIIVKLQPEHIITTNYDHLLENVNDPSDTLEIRKKLIQNDKVEAIIVLPRELFITTDISVSKFLVVHPREFIYNPRTHGKRIGFGYNNSKENFIISWNNIAFRVKKSMENIVLADYLFLHFKRDEWDREACFQSCNRAGVSYT